MKGRAITLPKREPNPLCEDASRLIPGRLLAVADGAGGGGLYADLWAQYLIEHLPTEVGFANAEALDGWLSGIWEEFYNACERQAQQSGSFYLNKFYDEGSFSTLAALWRVSPRSYYWVAYGDSVAFHYSRRQGTLSHSFGALRDFSLPPHLINCKDELRPEGFRSGYFTVEPGDRVFVTSDALAQYIVMMHLLTDRQTHQEEITQLLATGLRQSNYLRRALELPAIDLWRDVLRPLLSCATTSRHFARHIDSLLRQGLLAPDDYSIVWSKCYPPMNYPSISDYIEALRDAEDSLSKLKDLRLVYDDQGHPIMSSGNFAVVFKMQAPTGEYHALKCFLRDQEERSERYRLIAEELQYVQSTYLVKFRYLESELFVDVPNTGGEEYPVLLMDWVDGIPLDRYLKTIINDDYKKDLLAYRFSLLARWLISQHFAHGDLKPDNICVRDDGSLVLLDYDGMYVPALSGRKPLEQGSPHYRHPLRSTLPFDEHIDDYSLSLILLSLRAIALDKTLYVRYSSSEYLLLSEQDQLNPYISPVFTKLNHWVLSLGFINTYHTYLKALQSPHLHLEAYDFSLLAPILMYRRAAEMGDLEAMRSLVNCYYTGQGRLQGRLRIDETKTMEWYKKAAEAGNARAMCNLGYAYAYGQGGLRKDETKAVEWYQKAAEAGNARAMYNLGLCYHNGQGGLTKDTSKAVEWYQKAVEAGYAEAMWNLGACYEYGTEGLTKDTSKAMEWYQKAAEAGIIVAAERLQELGRNSS